MGRSTGNFSRGGSRSAGSRSFSTRSLGSRGSSGGGRASFSSGRSKGHGSASFGSKSASSGGFGSTKGPSTWSRSNPSGGSGSFGGGPSPMTPPPARPRWAMWGPGWFGSRRYRNYGPTYMPAGGGGCGCLTSLFSTVLTIALVFVLFLAIAPASCVNSFSSTSSSTGLTQSPTQVSTRVRTKLPSSQCTPIDLWYEDLAEWIDDPSAVTTGLKRFYDKTGVQPYLIISAGIQGNKDYDISQVETYMRGRYDDLFGDDDGHLILLFCEPYDGEYDPYLLVGLDAQSVIDVEAEDIIYNTIDRYYSDTSLSNSAYFGKIFSESADTIMAGSNTLTSTSQTAPQASRSLPSLIMVGIAAVACGGAIAFLILRFIRSKSQE